MNRQQVAAVLGLFSAAYPQTAISEATALLWADELAEIDPDQGLAAARRIVREDQRFPTIARMLEMVKACKPLPVTPELPYRGPVLSPEEVQNNLARVREAMQAAALRRLDR